MSEHEAQNSKSSGPSPLLVLLALGAVLAVVAVAALVFVNAGKQDPNDAQTTDTGAAIIGDDLYSTGVTEVDPKPISDFSLTRSDGSPLSLADLTGRYSVIYFGYTYCPDFCPSTMTDWRLIIRALGDEAARLNFLMVSVDPNRDQPEVLARYLLPFDPAIIGATGSESVLRSMADEFGAFFEPVAQDSSPLYMVNHTASQFVVDPAGNLVTVYAFGTPVDVITADLRAKLDGSR